jgi:hypothetical protein
MRVSRLKPTAIRRTAQGEPETIEARGAAGNVCTCSWMRGASVRWQRRDGVFHRDVGDGEHAEIIIGDRTYRGQMKDLV